jgi:outer membrane protein OmpA-like peptidoglycan-associated protein
MNTLNRILLSGMSVLLFNAHSFSQEEKDKCHHAEDKKAISNYEKGIDNKKYKRDERIDFLNKAIEIDPEYVEAYYKLGVIQVLLADLSKGVYKGVIAPFSKVIELCPTFHSDPFYYVGFAYYEEENYPEAVKYLQKYIDFKDEDPKKYNKNFEFFQSNAAQMIKYGKVYDELKKNIVPFDPKPVPGICTEKDEYLGIITLDDQQMYFTRRGKAVLKGKAWETTQLEEMFCYSIRDEHGNFDAGQKLPKPFNEESNQGGATLSSDNKHLFFTIGKDEGGEIQNFDIYTCDGGIGAWGPIKNLGAPVNDPKSWDSQPSISADGKTLYFSSDRPGGYGGADIWVTTKQKDGSWGVPANLGPKINTKGEEKTPFIHSDSETLYFSSDGLPGVGGQDIFYVRKDEKGAWEEPKNIGIPINTPADDVGLFVSTDGHYGYFASNLPQKNPGMGGYDIYSFELYEKARPQKVAFIKGELKNEDGKPPQNMKVEIKSANSKTKTEVLIDSATGSYSAVVNMKKKEDFIITVKKEGAAFTSQLVVADSVSAKPRQVNLEVKTMTPGAAYTLNNLYYRSNSAELEGRSKIVLEEFASYLKENPHVKIEIHGHTDNVGDAKTNLGLSTDRALTVYETLEKFGVAKTQLIAYKGFGATKPIADNASENGRSKNRRTEFFVVGN